MKWGVCVFVSYRPAALHSPSDKVVAVMGMDITLGYFHKLLAELLPPCEQTSIRWVVTFDDGGGGGDDGDSELLLMVIGGGGGGSVDDGVGDGELSLMVMVVIVLRVTLTLFTELIPFCKETDVRRVYNIITCLW